MRYDKNNYLFVVDQRSTTYYCRPSRAEGTDASGLKDAKGKASLPN
jgi:hypothetical protein